MDTTAKVSQASKKRLEAVRTEFARRTGRRVTQREVLEHLIRGASRDVSTAAAEFDGRNRSMGPREFRRFLRRRKPSGVTDLSSDIDGYLYGGRG
ncbi:MAG TPA: hypothetical protein VJ397_08850 [Thermoplasmata archaeon]|nr:hypothetical protein [Thermoplasmata archaeon]